MVACAALSSGLAQAQWQWVDGNGRKVYSDTAPPGDVPEKNILKRPAGRAMPAAPALDASSAPAASGGQAPGASPGALKVTGVDKELEAKKKAASDAEAAKKKADDERVAKAKAENCTRAKQARVSLDSGIRMSSVNDAGERIVLDDDARAAEARRVQSVIDSECH